MVEKSNNRIEKVAQFVFKHLKENESNREKLEYRWEHTLRVANYGKQIAKAEGADVELVIAACLLHDVAKFDPGEKKDHGRLSAKISRPMLLDIGYSQEQTNNICYSVAIHVDGHADFEFEETIESKVVTDADNIDRFGSYRILLWCAPKMGMYEELLNKLKERIATLKKYRQQDVLKTKRGCEIFRNQLDRQINFYEALLNEGDLTKLPTAFGEKAMIEATSQNKE